MVNPPLKVELEDVGPAGPSHKIGGPRGFLRIYVLYRLSKKPMSGYDLISELSAMTGGTWRPGSGSIYPILEDLKARGLVAGASRGKRARQVYSLTPRGRKQLADGRKMLNHMIYEFATRYNRIRLAMAGLVSAENLSTLVLELSRSNRVIWDQILGSKELSDAELELKLKEYRLHLEDELDWVRRGLKQLKA